MISLNFEILKYFTKVEEACADDITNALKGEYDSFKNLKKRSVIVTLMTAEAFGAIEKTRFQLDENGEIKVYYRSNKKNEVTIMNKIN
jgi:hypothetical protein